MGSIWPATYGAFGSGNVTLKLWDGDGTSALTRPSKTMPKRANMISFIEKKIIKKEEKRIKQRERKEGVREKIE